MADRDESGRWKPGQSANPAGRVPQPREWRDIKKLSPAYIRTIIAKLARMDREQMHEYLQKPLALGGPNNLELMVASIIHKATTDGDHTKLNFLLDRSIGKVVEEKRVTLEPVIYKTTIRGDGALVQEVLQEIADDEKES